MSRTAIVIAALACSLFAAPAQAAARARVFVASYGNDTNPCTFGSPCKTFQVAVDAVAAGGEVTAIDSAGFGPIIINKSVTITSPDGVEAGIATPAGQNAISINAGASDAVVLHGLTIDGANAAVDGIAFGSGKSLIISNCVIRNFTYGGIVLNASQSDTELTDSMIENNGMYGVYDAPVGAGLAFNFDHVRFLRNITAGISVQDANFDTSATILATGTNSFASGNGIGYEAIGHNLNVLFTLDNVTAIGNTTEGLHAKNANILLSRSFIANNDGAIGNGYVIEGIGAIISAVDSVVWDRSGGGTFQTAPGEVQ
jgi:hypothetical protein